MESHATVTSERWHCWKPQQLQLDLFGVNLHGHHLHGRGALVRAHQLDPSV
jgi:hypothetical protein